MLRRYTQSSTQEIAGDKEDLCTRSYQELQEKLDDAAKLALEHGRVKDDLLERQRQYQRDLYLANEQELTKTLLELKEEERIHHMDVSDVNADLSRSREREIMLQEEILRLKRELPSGSGSCYSGSGNHPSSSASRLASGLFMQKKRELESANRGCEKWYSNFINAKRDSEAATKEKDLLENHVFALEGRLEQCSRLQKIWQQEANHGISGLANAVVELPSPVALPSSTVFRFNQKVASGSDNHPSSSASRLAPTLPRQEKAPVTLVRTAVVFTPPAAMAAPPVAAPVPAAPAPAPVPAPVAAPVLDGADWMRSKVAARRRGRA